MTSRFNPHNNMRKTTRATPPIQVRDSEIHGRGVFAARDLPAGTTVGHYAGRRYLEDEIGDADWDSALTYLFGLSDGSVIDGSDGGNATRHLNHACEPNCEATEYRDRAGRLKLRITTLRPIATGDELLLDYALVIDDSDDPSDYACSCGTPRCRGTLVASDTA